jgi:hypothetical protein
MCDVLTSYAWREPGAVEAHWLIWARLLGGKASRMTAEQWAASIDEDIMLAAIANGSDLDFGLKKIRSDLELSGGLARLAA